MKKKHPKQAKPKKSKSATKLSSKPKEVKTTIVKRGWHIEPYDERKVYGSCVFACKMAHISQQEAEKIAERITPVISKEVLRKKFVSSDDIFRFIVAELAKHSEDASFMYETHRDIS